MVCGPISIHRVDLLVIGNWRGALIRVLLSLLCQEPVKSAFAQKATPLDILEWLHGAIENFCLDLCLLCLKVWDLDLSLISAYSKVCELIGHPVISITGEKVNLCLVCWFSLIRCDAAAPGLENLLTSQRIFTILIIASKAPLHVDRCLGFGWCATAKTYLFDWGALSSSFSVDGVLIDGKGHLMFLRNYLALLRAVGCLVAWTWKLNSQVVTTLTLAVSTRAKNLGCPSLRLILLSRLYYELVKAAN